MTDVRSGIKKVYKIFGYPEPPTPTPSTAEDISKRDLIRVSEVIFGAVGANPAGIETVTAPAPLIKINEFTPSIYNNFVYKMDYPSGYANLSTAINTASSILQSNPRTGISANSTYYKYIIVITDGLPSAPGESGDPLCNQDYGLLQDTISNEFRNSCPNARSNTKTAFQNAVADSNACMLILAYGPNAFTPHNTLNPHLTDYLNDSNNNLINHVNAQNPGNCDIEIDIHNKGDINSNPALQYIRFADSATSVGDELAAIAGLIDDTITSVTLQEINPQ